METNGNLEERIATLEREVAELKRKVEGDSKNWVDEISGNMMDFPEWREVCRMGKEIGNAQLKGRLDAISKSDVYLTVVSTHEQIMGANKFISQAKKREDYVRGYRMIESAMSGYERYKILHFDEPAAIKFEELRKQKVRVGTMDLRIASIVLSHDFTLLTRNTVDFEKVPGLRFEDWTVA